jgi:putative CocE/NonD family hydrolase
MVKARDGVSLATDVYRPALDGKPVEGQFPTIMERTPYNRTRLDLYLTGQYFASRGYVVVLQDSRGRYDSEGVFHHYWNPEATDGHDAVEWIAAQPWSDGKVGTTGLSFTSANQQALAITNPPHLTTQIILDGGLNFWHRTIRHSGAFQEGIFLPYVLWMAQAGKEAREDASVKAALQGMIANIGEWLKQLPLKRGASPLALAPSYEEWYFNYLTRPDYGEFWMNPMFNVGEYLDDYPDIPLCMVPSWYGHHTWANFEKYNYFRQRNESPVKLVCGTWLHAFEYMRDSWAGGVDFGNTVAFGLDDFRLRWFDQILKGLDTGVLDEPPMSLFVMGGGDGNRNLSGRMNHGGQWREAEEWPLPGTDFRSYYLHADGALRTEPPGESEPTTYTFDPRDPVPTVGGAVEDPLGGESGIINGGAFDQRGRRDLILCGDTLPLAARPDVLAFRTEPLAEAVEVTGPITVRLWVSSSAVDTDFTAKLIDEHPPNGDYPEGFAMNLTDSIVRMRYRENRTKGELIEPSEIYEIEIEPQPTSNLFAAGHRIRLDISSSSAPQFDVNPNTGGPLGVSLGGVVARNTVYHDGAHPSQVVLPIVPRD